MRALTTPHTSSRAFNDCLCIQFGLSADDSGVFARLPAKPFRSELAAPACPPAASVLCSRNTPLGRVHVHVISSSMHMFEALQGALGWLMARCQRVCSQVAGMLRLPPSQGQSRIGLPGWLGHRSRRRDLSAAAEKPSSGFLIVGAAHLLGMQSNNNFLPSTSCANN